MTEIIYSLFIVYYKNLSPNGNASLTSSFSLSWTSTIKPLDPFPDRGQELMTAIEIIFVFLF